jgi:hypothetical protein
MECPHIDLSNGTTLGPIQSGWLVPSSGEKVNHLVTFHHLTDNKMIRVSISVSYQNGQRKFFDKI